MTKIILTRHGDVEGIKPERFRGRTELPLTELGQAQAKAVAARIAKTWNPAKVYTSPMGAAASLGGFARGDGFAATTNGRGGRRGCFGRDFCAILHRKVNAAENVSRV
jgi:Histidine phosphatase superfamily (branch 1)